MMHSMSDVSAIVIPLATAAIAGGAALAGALVGGRTQKSQWLRAERRQAYVELLAAAWAFTRAPHPPEGHSKLATAQSTVEVVGPVRILPAAKRLYDAALGLSENRTSRGEFNDATLDFADAARSVFE
jgi:hypothetical protein